MRHRLTKQAEHDVSKILTDTYRLFGELQFGRYVSLLNKGIDMIADVPFRPTSKDRGDIREGIRSFHLQLAAGRRGGASHVLYYRPPQEPGSDAVIILRILGDEMEPKRRVSAALRADKSDQK